MAINFEGLGEQKVTFAAANGTAKGTVCKLSANNTVAGCTAGDVFFGVVESVRGGKAAVITEGYAEVGYTGTAPSLGYNILAANGSGGVKGAENGRDCLVVSVDTTNKIIGMFL